MKNWMLVCIVLACSLYALVACFGCGNVKLTGEAEQAAKVSTLDAYNAAQRATTQPAVPSWATSYLWENYKQWRFFVRADLADEAWGLPTPEETTGGGVK